MADFFLPGRSSGGTRRRVQRAPTAADVPTVSPASDPGLRVSGGAFGGGVGEGLAAFGANLSDFGDDLQRRIAKQQDTYDKTKITEGLLSFEREAMAEYRRRTTEDDATRPGFLPDFDKWMGIQQGEDGSLTLSGRGAEIIQALPEDVSTAARETLQTKILQAAAGISDSAGRFALIQNQKDAVDATTAFVDKLTSQVVQYPEFLPEFMKELDEGLAEFLPVLTPDQEREIVRNGNLRLIESAVTGMVERGDYRGAETLLAEVEVSGETRLALDRIVEQGRKAERAEIKVLTDDHLESIQQTGQGIAGLSDRAERIMEPEDYADFRRRERVSERYFGAVQGMRFATPAEMAAELERWRPESGSETFAEDMDLFETLQRGAAQMLQTRTADPAGYAMAIPHVAKAFAAVGDDPTALQRAVRVRQDAQADMGLPAVARRPLAQAEAEGLAVQIQSASAEDRPAVMAQISESYGPLMPEVMGQLAEEGLDARYQVLASLVGKPALAQTVAQAIDTGSAELAKGLDTAAVKDIKTGVREELADFARTIELGDFTGGRTEQINAIVSAVEDTAVQYYRQTGDTALAVRRAVEQIVLDRYHVGDTWYAPVGIGRVGIDRGRLEAALEAKQSREIIEEFGPAPLGTMFEEEAPEEVRREAIIQTAVNSGYWVTNEQGSGAFLMIPMAGGGAIPLLDASGNRLTVDFLDATRTPFFVEGETPDPALVEFGMARGARRPVSSAFSPEGSGYDYSTARAAGMGPDGTGENAGHWGSVAPASAADRKKHKLPDNSFIMLKGRKHETWDRAVEAEEARGFRVIKLGKRYYSVPEGFKT